MAEETLPAGWTAHTAPSGHTYYWNAALKKSTYKRPVAAAASVSDQVTQVDDLEPRSKRIKSVLPDGDRPKRKVVLAHAPGWFVVHTELGRAFYHHTASGMSRWTAPELSDAGKQQEEDNGEVATASASDVDGVSSSVSEYEDEDDNDDDEAPSGADEEADELEWQLQELDQMQVEEDSDPFAGRTKQERVQIFRGLLNDAKVDPLRPFDPQVEEIAHDERYLALTSIKERKGAFDVWCRDTVAASRSHAVTGPSMSARAAFLSLVAKHEKKCQFFADFKRKHRKDAAYLQFGNTDHERERVFRLVREHARRPLATRLADYEALLRDTNQQRQQESSPPGSEDPNESSNDVRYHVLTPAERNHLG
ncbi:hypothetical protein PYCC9005_003612 [Savitreella phatthalungensis]